MESGVGLLSYCVALPPVRRSNQFYLIQVCSLRSLANGCSESARAHCKVPVFPAGLDRGFITTMAAALKQILEATHLGQAFCAHLLRVPVQRFREWAEGTRPLPPFVLPELCAVLGVSEKTLLETKPRSQEGLETLAPAIWFRLRVDSLTDADRELVGAVRQLGFFYAQFEKMKGWRSATAWTVVRDAVRQSVDRSLPPALQGREAAIRFRSSLQLDHGSGGIGEVMRPKLRRLGLLVLESPIPKSSLEGCCFSVGKDDDLFPCVFANSFKSTWFRRNETILHEVSHALFELENDPVSLDFRDDEEKATIPEVRARAFAQESLVPATVLSHCAQRFGMDWENLTPEDVARLMAETHVEQRTLLRAAYENGLIRDRQRLEEALGFSCGSLLKVFSSHALNTEEYLAGHPEHAAWIRRSRNTSVGTRSLRLPAGYLKEIVERLNDGSLTLGKASELAMMDPYSFLERFGDLIQEPALP